MGEVERAVTESEEDVKKKRLEKWLGKTTG